MSKSEPPEPVPSDVPKLELAPVPVAGGLAVELNAELGAELPELDAPEEPEVPEAPPELPEVLPLWATATKRHARVIAIAIQSRLEIMR
jgi:hypothetical protein